MAETNTFIGLTAQEQALWDLFTPTVEELGLVLVNITVRQSTTPVLEVLADVPNASRGHGITLDQCATLSRRLGRLLDVEDAFPAAFNLEVSSPGVERPFATVAALQEAVGQTVKAKLGVPIEGQGKIKGVLKRADETMIEIDAKDENFEIALGNIREIKRILSETEYQDLMKGVQ